MGDHKDEADHPDRQLRVLIVDDDVRVRRALRELVQSSPDLTVVGAAASSRRALLNDLEFAPEVVILDVLLPDAEDGLNVLRVLRSRNRPVVAISVLGSLRQQALAAGAFAFLEKEGGEIDTLKDTIRAAAHRL